MLVQAQACKSAIWRPSCKLKQTLKIGLNTHFFYDYFLALEWLQ